MVLNEYFFVNSQSGHRAREAKVFPAALTMAFRGEVNQNEGIPQSGGCYSSWLAGVEAEGLEARTSPGSRYCGNVTKTQTALRKAGTCEDCGFLILNQKSSLH